RVLSGWLVSGWLVSGRLVSGWSVVPRRSRLPGWAVVPGRAAWSGWLTPAAAAHPGTGRHGRGRAGRRGGHDLRRDLGHVVQPGADHITGREQDRPRPSGRDL